MFIYFVTSTKNTCFSDKTLEESKGHRGVFNVKASPKRTSEHDHWFCSHSLMHKQLSNGSQNRGGWKLANVTASNERLQLARLCSLFPTVISHLESIIPKQGLFLAGGYLLSGLLWHLPVIISNCFLSWPHFSFYFSIFRVLCWFGSPSYHPRLFRRHFLYGSSESCALFNQVYVEKGKKKTSKPLSKHILKKMCRSCQLHK